MPGITTLPVTSDPASGDGDRVGQVGVLVLAWSAEEPLRVGEIAMLTEGKEHVFGRGEGEPDETRVRFFRQRPGTLDAGPPLAGAGLSRRQLSLRAQEGTLEVERIGQCELRVNGAPRDRATIRPGDTLHLRRQVVLLFLRRAVLMPKGRYFPRASWGEFGDPDAQGILGESQAAWLLREHLGFVAKAATHALLVGASGTGKELAARAIHALSPRASKPWVARNAATLPPGLIDAELFGNAKNYPNAGMTERPGLIGQADGGTLFLDEIAELPAEQQSHLLRVLDAGGEYQRLGESTCRRSDFRLVGATNRDPSVLKHDLRARLTSVVELSPLSSRREDIPLLARHLLMGAAKRSPDVAARFVEGSAKGRPHARFTPAFVEYILRQEFTTNARELEAVLWRAMSEATGADLAPPTGLAGESGSAPERPTKVASRTAVEPSIERIRAALADAGGSVEKAARALGLSRFALYRLVKKHGL
jgi:two-component system, NtrC family, response regulator HydG